MQRRGVSPWLIKQRRRIRTEPPKGVAHCVATGDHPIMAWRVDTCLSIERLSRLTGIEFDRLIDVDCGREPAMLEEIDALAVALRVEPALLHRMVAEADLAGRGARR